MSTAAIPIRKKRPGWRDKVRYLAGSVVPAMRVKTRITLRGLQDQAYTLLGLGCFSAAGFEHSVFTGTIVLGISWFALEVKTKGQ